MANLTNIQKKALEITGLDATKVSPRGWIYGRCPYCGHESKFGLKINHDREKYKNHISFNCFKGSCKEKGSEWHLFKQFNIQYLLSEKAPIVEMNSIESDLNTTYSKDEAVVEDNEKRYPPVGWLRIFESSYLRERGWEDWQFQQYQIGVTELYSKLKGYLVLLIIENGENRGYVARSIQSPEWISNYNSEVKIYNKTCVPSQRKHIHTKYHNEGGVAFENLLFGIDEVTVNTEVVILVEGPFDKTNTDKELKLNLSEKVKCLCTFGKKISSSQINKIKDKGVKRVIVLYDPDAINSSKQFGFELEKHFKVLLATHSTKDPGEMKREDFNQTLAAAKLPIIYYANMTGSLL